MAIRAVPVPARGGLSELDYVLPQGVDRIAAGTRVLVPIGPRRSMAVVVEPDVQSEHVGRLKPIIAVLDPEPILDRKLFELIRWMADYYLHPLGEAVETALPGALRMETEMWVELADTGEPRPGDRSLYEYLGAAGPQPASQLVHRFGHAARRVVARLKRAGKVRVTVKRCSAGAPR
jgi:primosomal protein N'